MVTHLYGNVYTRVGIAHALADSFDLGLLGEQSSQKFVIPCLGRRNCWAKCDAASFILGKKKTEPYKHTHTKQ